MTVHLHALNLPSAAVSATGAASRALRSAARSVDKFTREHCGGCAQGHAALEVAGMLFDLFEKTRIPGGCITALPFATAKFFTFISCAETT